MGGNSTRLKVGELEQAIYQPVEFEDWRPERFTDQRKLQKAARNYGEVVQYLDSKTGMMVAVKQMPNDWIQDGHGTFTTVHKDAIEHPWRDIGCLRYLNTRRYEHVLEYVGLFRDDSTTYFAMELAQHGDLFAWCDREPALGVGREPMLVPIFVQILEAVQWLHAIGIIHRDLSIENIVLTGDESEPQVKIIDFAMATTTRFQKGSPRGKFPYVAPEMFDRKVPHDGFLTDAFACGVILYGSTVQDYPWAATMGQSCKCFAYAEENGIRPLLQLRKVRKEFLQPGEERWTVEETLSPQLFDLIEALICLHPNSRASLGEAQLWNRRAVWDFPWLGRCEQGLDSISTVKEECSSPVHVNYNDANYGLALGG